MIHFYVVDGIPIVGNFTFWHISDMTDARKCLLQRAYLGARFTAEI